jgi:hypothetical protein
MRAHGSLPPANENFLDSHITARPRRAARQPQRKNCNGIKQKPMQMIRLDYVRAARRSGGLSLFVLGRQPVTLAGGSELRCLRAGFRRLCARAVSDINLPAR